MEKCERCTWRIWESCCCSKPDLWKLQMPFATKDSWTRKEFSNGFVRDDDWSKLRYDLIPTSMLERLAWLYTRWAIKYWDCNWQKAIGRDAIERFKQSAWRHFIHWQNWEYDEDHWFWVCRNVFAYERHINRMRDNNLIYHENWEDEISWK